MTVMDDKKTEREKDDSFIQSLDSLREILADESGTVDTSLLSDILTKASQETGIAFNEEALLEHLQPIIMTPESKGSTQLGLSLPRTTPLTSNTRIGSAQRMASQSHNRRSSNIFSFDTPSGKPSPLVNTTDSPNKPNAEGPGFFDTAEPSFSEDNSGFHVQIITKSDTNGIDKSPNSHFSNDSPSSDYKKQLRIERDLLACQEKLQFADARIQDLTEQLISSENTLKSRTRELSDSITQSDTLFQQISQLETRLADAQQTSRLETETRVKLQKQLEYKESTEELLKETIRTKENEIESLGKSQNGSQTELSDLRGKANDLETRLRRTTSALDSLNHTLKEKNALIDASQHTQKKLETRIAELTLEVNELRMTNNHNSLSTNNKNSLAAEMNQYNMKSSTAIGIQTSLDDSILDQDTETKTKLESVVFLLLEQQELMDQQKIALRNEMDKLKSDVLQTRQGLNIRKHYDAEVDRLITVLRADVGNVEHISKTFKALLNDEIENISNMHRQVLYDAQIVNAHSEINPVCCEDVSTQTIIELVTTREIEQISDIEDTRELWLDKPQINETIKSGSNLFFFWLIVISMTTLVITWPFGERIPSGRVIFVSGFRVAAHRILAALERNIYGGNELMTGAQII